MKNKNYAVGYCRFSSDGQREESIDGQKRAIIKYAQEHNLIISKWYIDEACSAKTARRPQFQQMIKDSKLREFDTLLIYKIDRFSRDDYDTVFYKRQLRLNGVKIISVCENIDESPQGQILLKLLEAMAVFYSQNLATEVKKGMNENAHNCQCNGGVPPYGYMRVPRMENGQVKYSKKGRVLHDTVLDPTNSEAVKLIFEMTIQGHTRHEIMDKLNELGYKDNKGREFKNATILDRILRNERYTGVYLFNQTKTVISERGTIIRGVNEENVIRVEGGMPKIVDKESFLKVQRILAQRVHRSPSNTKEHYLLSGKIVCGECGKSYQGWKKCKEGEDYVYYKCTNNGKYYKGSPKEEYCKNSSIRRDDIEKLVINEIISILSDPKLVDKIYDDYNKFVIATKSNASLIETLEKKIEHVETKINNIVNIFANGHYSETLENKLTEFEKEKEQLILSKSQEQENLGCITINKEELQEAINKAKEILVDKEQDFETRKMIVQSFLNKIIVYKDNVEVYINVIPTGVCGNLNLDIKVKELSAIDLFNESLTNTSEDDNIYFNNDINGVDLLGKKCIGAPDSPYGLFFNL